jgi:hypothetical protein
MDFLPLLKNFEIDQNAKSVYTEEEIIEILSKQIAWLLEHRTEFLFSQMYRMDIDERLVRKALHPSNETSAAEGLARLVLQRQKMRLKTKQDIRVDEIDPDLAW